MTKGRLLRASESPDPVAPAADRRRMPGLHHPGLLQQGSAVELRARVDEEVGSGCWAMRCKLTAGPGLTAALIDERTLLTSL